MVRNDVLLTEAQAHAEAGRFDEALAILTRVLRSEPNHFGALMGAAMTYLAKGDVVRATYHARRAQAVDGGPRPRLMLAMTLERSGEIDEALRVLGAMVDGPKAYAPACGRYAGLLCARGRADEAVALARGWMERWPHDPSMVQVLCRALTRLGDAAAVCAGIAQGVERFPNHRPFREWLASAANYLDSMDEAAVVDLARAHAALLPVAPPAGRVPRRAADGVIRVGFISPDFRTHSVAYFLRPLLKAMDRPAFRVYGYDTGEQPDATTAELRGLMDEWRNCRRLRDESVASGIRGDGVDVLVDLAGLTLGCTPGVFAHRAAPVQVSYLGYANTTALPGMDARLTDSLADPIGAEGMYSERLVRLDPCFVCYEPPKDLPAVRAREAEGSAVFGSFNALLKVTPRTVDLWSRVLLAVPGSRLLLKAWGLECAATRARLTGLLAAGGVAGERLEFAPLTTGVREHLDTYNRVDIALDTFPYHGTTTTCEALSMGVPVVSRVGDVHRARVGLSLLTAVGLSELAAPSDEAFVQAAVALARDPVRRAGWRSAGPDGLRARLLASALCDGRAYARRFEAALRSLVGAALA